MRKYLLFLHLAAAILSAAAQDRGLEVIARAMAESPSYEVGRRYAVIIGIDRYQEWIPLGNAVAEAKGLKRILAGKYHFDEFIELYDADATVANIRRLFAERLPGIVGLHDSVLVFYAGHGYLDSSKSGFWIPVDGGVDRYEQKAWLPNAQLKNYIGLLKARSVLVVADACFAGTLLDIQRGAAPEIDSAYFKRALTLTSRQVLSSGASETVPDESEFGRQLLDFLDRNTDQVVDALAIYERVRRGVTKSMPLFGSLPGNEAGASFVLFRRASSDLSASPQAAGSPTPGAAVAPPPSKGTLVIRASGPYAARAAPVGSEEEGFRIEANVVSAEAGDYVLTARLPDDIDDTYRAEFTIRAGESTTVALPPLERSRSFRLAELARERQLLTGEFDRKKAALPGRRAAGWIGLGLGVAGAAAAAFGYLDGTAAYAAYSNAATTSEADSAEARARFDAVLLWSGLGSGAAFLIAGPVLLVGDPAARISESIRAIDRQIEDLRR